MVGRGVSARVFTSCPPYRLWPFQNYRTFCPYLFEGLDRVAEKLRLYLERGFRTFIVDMPRSYDDLHHANLAFDRVGATVAA